MNVDYHTSCYSDKGKLFCQMTSPQEAGSILFVSENSKSSRTKAIIRESKINQGVSGKFNAATVQLLLGEVLILPSDPNFQVHRNAVFHVVLVLFEDAPRMQYVIP